jgi:hypothetical protein
VYLIIYLFNDSALSGLAQSYKRRKCSEVSYLIRMNSTINELGNSMTSPHAFLTSQSRRHDNPTLLGRAGFVVPTTVAVKGTVFWVVTPYISERDRRLREYISSIFRE